MAKLKKQHMTIHWKAIVQDDSSIPATEATLKEKATLVGRIGLMMLSVGTGAWRVRNSMNKVSRCLGITCTADIGLLAISYTCIEGTDTYTQSISLPTTGVNTHKLMELELFMKEFPDKVSTYSVKHIHEVLDEIQNFLPTIRHGIWGLPLHWRAVHLPFCWAVGLSKCAVPFWVQVSGTLSAKRCWGIAFPCWQMLRSVLPPPVWSMSSPFCWRNSFCLYRQSIRLVTSVRCCLSFRDFR